MAAVDSASARLAAQLRRALSVRNHVDISASRDVVFGAVSEPRHLETFHPRPQFVFFLLGRRWVRKSLETYLRSVLLGLKHYCETGKTVAPNQWGVHPYFSAA